MTPRALVLAALALLPGCLSPTGGGDASDGATSGESGTSDDEGSSGVPTTTATPTSGSSDEGGASCDGCAAEQACIDGVCEDVGRGELERGCNPLGDPSRRGQCLYPWPSSFLAVPDGATATRERLVYDPELLPKNNEMKAFAVDEVATGLDGFSPNSQIRFVLAGGVDAADLVAIDDIGRSLAEDSPIVLLDADSGERWPFFAERDATAQAGEPVTIFIRPMRRMNFGARYVVALRGLHDDDGQVIAAPPLFRALRDDLKTDVPQLEALREGHAEIFAALAKAGVAREELQLAWDFRTASASSVQRDLLEMAPQVEAIAGAGDLGYTIDEIDMNPSPNLARVLRGRFNAPRCLITSKEPAKSEPGATMQRLADGTPDCSGTIEAPFVIAVPQQVWDTGSPVPFVLWGHGLLGTGESAVGIAEQAGGVIVAGTDFWGMSEEDIPAVLVALSESLHGGNAMPDRLLQSSVNFATLGLLAQGELLQDDALKVEVDMVPQTLIDPANVAYLGGSQGGIMGGTVLAMAPNLSRGILVVGGSNYSLMIWRSTAFSQLSNAWAASHSDPQEREFLFAIFQSAFDRADPTSFAELMAEPPGGGEPKRLLLIESIGDAQVPNIATEMMARSFGMPMLVPAHHPVFGVEDAAEPLQSGSALLQVDTGKGPLPPVENLPLDDDNGAHGSAVDDPALLAVIERFIFKGILENLCDGPCDPG